MVNYIWVAVENDEYELPIFVEDSAEKLASKLGISRSAVNKRVDRKVQKIRSNYKIIKVEV